MASLCHCTGCIRKNCGVCKACLESNGDCCLLRRCQRFAYSPESDEKWHLESRQLFPNNLQFNRPHAPQKEPPRHIILTIEEDDDTDDVNNHSIPILPKLISTLHEDVIVQRPPSFGYTCGTCSKCQIGACRLCLKCCNTARQERCPFLACEAVSYSINYINSMERNARQALRSNPERLTLLYDSLFGDDGFMTRQKAERQKEKETIYANMFGERGDTPNRQIMLRSRFPRTPITPDESPCGYDSWKFDMAKMTRCKGKIRKVAKKSRTPKVYASHKCRRCNRMCSSHPNIRGLCMGCSKTENVQTAGFHLKDKCGPIVGQKRKQSKTDPVFMQQSDNIEPRHNTPRSKFPPKRLFADEHAPLSNDKVTPIMSFQRKRHVQCRRCSIVTVCGLCIDCNRIENIHQIGSLLPPLQGDDIYSSRKAHLINYIQSSLKIAVQTMESKQMDGGAYACSSFEERSEPRKLKVKFADSSYSYMERLWRERDNPYLFGDSLLHRADSLVAGIDASPRCGK